MSLRTLRRFKEGGERGFVLTAVLFAALVLIVLPAIASAYGEFRAEGKRGWVKFTGRGGSVTVEGKGKLWVTVTRDSKAQVEGTYKSHTREGLTDYYEGFQGKATLSGLNFKVEIRGENIRFEALARGKAAMNGVGTFSTKKTPSGKWGEDYKWVHCSF